LKKRYFVILVLFFINFLFCQQDTFYQKSKKNIQTDEWFAIDKAQHFMYSTFVALGTQYVLVNKLKMKENAALPISSSISFSAGLLKEINDNRARNGYFSKKDMVANSFGILFAGIFISY
tara:strand:- start:261 stop:620 length:360 start_codon:yes stop_codon:yes gene_type:complete